METEHPARTLENIILDDEKSWLSTEAQQVLDFAAVCGGEAYNPGAWECYNGPPDPDAAALRIIGVSMYLWVQTEDACHTTWEAMPREVKLWQDRAEVWQDLAGWYPRNKS